MAPFPSHQPQFASGSMSAALSLWFAERESHSVFTQMRGAPGAVKPRRRKQKPITGERA